MAKTSFLDIPEEYKLLVKKNLTSGDRFVIPRVYAKKVIVRRKQLTGITQRSLLPEISSAWNNLSAEVKENWATAGVVSGITGYRHFTQEYTLRKKLSLTPITTPSVFRQGKVGKIIISAPADDLRIQQDHPIKYYIDVKVRGTRNQYTQALVTEYVSFPINLKISYKSNLTTTSEFYKAKIFIYVVSNYQGREIETQKEINFDLESDWQTDEVTLDNVFGVFRYYRLVLDFQNVRGEFYFDNVKLYHSGKNWVRDTKCNDINQGFTKRYYQVSKNWVADVISEGADFESVYLDN
jgi:hypothetical protein